MGDGTIEGADCRVRPKPPSHGFGCIPLLSRLEVEEIDHAAGKRGAALGLPVGGTGAGRGSIHEGEARKSRGRGGAWRRRWTTDQLQLQGSRVLHLQLAGNGHAVAQLQASSDPQRWRSEQSDALGIIVQGSEHVLHDHNLRAIQRLRNRAGRDGPGLEPVELLRAGLQAAEADGEPAQSWQHVGLQSHLNFRLPHGFQVAWPHNRDPSLQRRLVLRLRVQAYT
mmetsp:Transcript_113271/g.360002  ORF Transcript_113271/g.360002 Transcript_113271/m.360002 type:complete len:224 (-) Transcript_113271:510-1181(-)